MVKGCNLRERSLLPFCDAGFYIDFEILRQIVRADRDSDVEQLEEVGNRSRLQLQPRRNLHRNYRLDFAAHAPDQCLQPVERRKRRNRLLHVIVGEIQFDNLDARAVERLRNFTISSSVLPTTLPTIALPPAPSSRAIATKCSTPRFLRLSGASRPAILHDLKTSAPACCALNS